MNVFYRYAKWADKYVMDDSLDEPILVVFPKFIVLMLIPMFIIIIGTMAAIALTISLLWRIIPWLFDLVWI